MRDRLEDFLDRAFASSSFSEFELQLNAIRSCFQTVQSKADACALHEQQQAPEREGGGEPWTGTLQEV